MRYLPKTIRAQTLAAVSSIVIAVIVLLVWVTIYVTESHLYELGERDARDRVQAVAARAGFAAIVGADSPEVPKEFVIESTVNGILATELIATNNRSVALLEQEPGLLASCFSYTGEDSAIITSRRVGRLWCISASVFQRTSAATCYTTQCVIGHLHVVATAQPVTAIVRRLIQTIVIVGGCLLIIAIIGLWRVAATISSPLRDIVSVMRRFATGERTARAEERGPDEVLTISRVYNALIDSQEEQARSLEQTVERRTLELKAATLSAQDAERYKTIFMAHMSHDMRTPLHVIEAQAADVMQELEFGSDPSVARAHVDVIIQQSRELSLRVAQVLELTRGETGHLDLDWGSLSLKALRDVLLAKGELLAKEHGNTLSLDIDEGVVWTDGNKVLQIVNNLMENACKFTERGTVHVGVQLQGPQVLISVADTGAGIPARQLEHIWSEFRQVQSSDGRRAGGFGLGLAIVRQYATILRGQYGADSIEGQGTRVWVTLPATESEWRGRAA